MTYSRAKVQGQRSIGSRDRVETKGRTDRRKDGGDRITSLANALGRNQASVPHSIFRLTTVTPRRTNIVMLGLASDGHYSGQTGTAGRVLSG